MLLTFTFSSCGKAELYIQQIKQALQREKTPKQVAGLPDSEKATFTPLPPEPVKMETVINKKARVAILGYHDFTESRRPTQMIIDIKDFRHQMQAIKDAKIPVISMRQFLDWKQGRKDIPEESIVINIDDGWKDTHTLAMPVLKEFDFPFTAFLYQKYVGVGGRSLTHSQIRELIGAGGTISSHSVSHMNMAKPVGRTAEEKIAWIKAELRDSYEFLVQNFSEGAIKTFAFPFGIYDDQILTLAREFEYEACFTVSPGKVTWETNNLTINRYIIHGNAQSTFDAAISFEGGTNGLSSGSKMITEQRDRATGEIRGALIEVYPPRGATVRNRLPRIEVNLAALDKIQSDGMVMRVSGLGKVSHQYNEATKIVSYQLPVRLRHEKCSVQLSFRHSGNRDWEVINWNFSIDQVSEYLSPETTFLRPADQPVDPTTDLVVPNKTPEKVVAEIKTTENAAESSPKDLIAPGNTVN